ncbi:endonuclease VII domain-containing protein [Streptomyces cinereoruber]|uniref:endonuclease VII domain-containing protein n=1 Tax=Streptomyces cinereoruber TaxID=67260 RepID=UPI003627A399
MEPSKKCKECGETKPLTAFHIESEGRRRNVCAVCRSNLRRGNRQEPREQRLKRSLASKYKITLEQFAALNEAQNGVCAICASPPVAAQRLYVDHCHASGRVRALLCGPCNTQLGSYEKLRDQAAAYLAKYGAGNPLLNYDDAATQQPPAA